MPQIRQPCAGALGGADLRLIAHMNSDDRETDFWMRQEKDDRWGGHAFFCTEKTSAFQGTASAL